jgi:hypothetical protein
MEALAMRTIFAFLILAGAASAMEPPAYTPDSMPEYITVDVPSYKADAPAPVKAKTHLEWCRSCNAWIEVADAPPTVIAQSGPVTLGSGPTVVTLTPAKCSAACTCGTAAATVKSTVTTTQSTTFAVARKNPLREAFKKLFAPRRARGGCGL